MKLMGRYTKVVPIPFTGKVIVDEFEVERLMDIEDAWCDIFNLCSELGWDCSELGTAREGILNFIRQFKSSGTYQGIQHLLPFTSGESD